MVEFFHSKKRIENFLPTDFSRLQETPDTHSKKTNQIHNQKTTKTTTNHFHKLPTKEQKRTDRGDPTQKINLSISNH